jgi:hypothetical protein
MNTTTLSPYSETPVIVMDWPSDAWLFPPPMEYIQFTTDITQVKKVLTL